MANRCYLIKKPNSNQNAVYKEQDIVFGASYCIPFFWLSLFDKTDIKRMKLPGKQEENVMYYYDPEEWDEKASPFPDNFPTLIVETSVAIRRFKERKEIILAKIPSEQCGLYDQWLEVLQDIKEPFVQLDMHELWAMVVSYKKEDPGLFDNNLVKALEAFQNGSEESWKTLFTYFVDSDYNAKLKKMSLPKTPASTQALPHLLCGYGWLNAYFW